MIHLILTNLVLVSRTYLPFPVYEIMWSVMCFYMKACPQSLVFQQSLLLSSMVKIQIHD